MLISIVRLYQAWRRHETARRELSHLTDRELADIGITRSDIERIASGEAFANRPRACRRRWRASPEITSPAWAALIRPKLSNSARANIMGVVSFMHFTDGLH